ncbi:DUF2207 domain-containing protein [Nocardioides sp.]|uniref:DUF2207 domain-containing protein n=1 Tax=Nocardioides sp. TaxID=35761 RepID=UPI002ED151BC
MKRVVVGVLGLVVLGAAVLFPSWVFDLASPGDVAEPTTITRYVARFTVDPDGTMRAVETIDVRVSTNDRHGIFRFFDRADRSAPHLRRDPYDVGVLQDGEPAQVELLTEDHGRFLVAKIGDPDRTLTQGVHTYRISYAVDDVLIDDPGGEGSRFYWQVLPGGWAQDVQLFRASVRLPTNSTDLQCAIGTGTTSPCPWLTGEGSEVVRLGPFGTEAFTPATVQADLATPVPPLKGEEFAWGPEYDPVLGPVPVLVLVVIAGLGALVVGLWLSYRVFERTPPFPLQYAPPPGIGPAQAAYVLHERVGREQFVATVLHAAEQGVVELQRGGDTWTIRDRGDWGRLDPVSSGLASLTGSTGSFSASAGGVSAGQRLKEQLDRFEDDVEQWARRERLVVRGPLGGVGGALVVVSFCAAIAIGVTALFGMSLLAIVPGLFAVGAVGLLMPGSGTLRSRTGRDLWSRVGGFERVLATPSSKDRFDFSGREELYTAYLPWAVAFGVASQWAAKYRTETGVEPPVPAYFAGGYAGSDPGAHVTHLVHDFSSTVDSAIGSYQATQSSSSGGGGGFSGGGGGGGGGGGSW